MEEAVELKYIFRNDFYVYMKAEGEVSEKRLHVH